MDATSAQPAQCEPVMPVLTAQAEAQAYAQTRAAHWDAVAERYLRWPGLGGYYHERLASVYRRLVAPGSRVLELGCSRGDLLAALEPAAGGGVGVDLSPRMIELARQRYPHLRFECADVHDLQLDETFDVIVMSDLVNDLWDVQAALDRVRRLCHPRTRVVLNFFSRLWELPLWLARKLGLASPLMEQNWFMPQDVTSILQLADFEVMRRWTEVVWPVRTPLIDEFCNRVLARLWPMSQLALTNVVVARPMPATLARDAAPAEPPIVSVVVPARNESGNIDAIIQRVPEMGGGTELVFVEGNSTDDTWEAIQRAVASHPQRRCVTLQQPGKGKGDAVRCGFAASTGRILMILDADLTVPPEDLPRFYDAIAGDKGDFINGVRLVYPMQAQAMRFLNLVGNKFFSVAFSWLLGQPIKDTLCGTKVLWRDDYDRIVANRAYFGDFDPFGDFDLLFGAARLNLKILDLPIRYRQRTYGTTNISRFRHGLLLLRMTAFAARKIKFV
jgi:ubiquinone/menaquinone biosynthesis C-methylase UbiE